MPTAAATAPVTAPKPAKRTSRAGFPPLRSAMRIIERLQRGTVSLADGEALDLEGRRHLAVGDGEGLAGEDEAAHALDRRQLGVDPRHRCADQLVELGIMHKIGIPVI